MTDKWAEYKQKFCGCKDASRLNRCQGRNNCELPEGHHERVSATRAVPRQPEEPEMTKVTIDRELLERVIYLLELAELDGPCFRELRAILAAPRQPEGEGLEVVGYAVTRDGDASFPWLCKTERIALSSAEQVTLSPKASVEPLMTVAQHQRITAAMAAELERLKHAAAGELVERLAAQLVESGAENYQEAHFDLEFEASGIKCVAVVRLQHPDKPSPHELRQQAEAERDTLRQQLADAQLELSGIENVKADLAKALNYNELRWSGLILEAQTAVEQRDMLAKLLREVRNLPDAFGMLEHIDAALAEVKS